MEENARVEDIMQRDPTCLQVGDRLDLPDDIMSLGRIRHLPVLDGKRLVGVVSQRDLLARSLARALALGARERREQLQVVEVADAMSQRLISVAVRATQRDAARLMLRHRVGCLPVVDFDGSLVGLVTQTDLIRSAYGVVADEAK